MAMRQRVASVRGRRFVGSLEQLELRRLLSTVYPDLPFVDKPLGNPALPGGVQAFAPPVSASTPAAAAPDFADWIKTASPNHTLSLTGDEFSTFTGSDFAKDTRFFVYGQTTGGNAALKPAAIQRIDGAHAAVTLDATLPNDSMYFVWAQNNAGVGYPIAVNQTEAWWVGFDQASRGETVSVYGRNLASGANQNVAHVYLTAPGATTGVWATVTSANPYKVDFTVPSSLANGQYEVWVHNGRGGQYGWSSPTAPNGNRRLLTVRDAIVWNGPMYNVKTQYGAIGDGVVDDGPAIQAAIADASAYATANPGSRPTVFLPAGTYRTFSQIVPASNVRIQGAGTDASGNWVSTIRRAVRPMGVWNFDNNLNDISRNNAHGVVIGNTSYVAGWKTAGAFAFDGSTYVNVGAPSALNITGEITLAARFKAPSGGGNQTLISRSGGGNSVFLRLNNNTVQFGYSSGGGEVLVSYAYTPNNAWTTWFGTYEQGQLKLYQGTTLRATLNHAGGVPAITGDWTIGANNNGGNKFTGAIDAARIYTRGLGNGERTNFTNATSETTSEFQVYGGSAINFNELADIQLASDTGSFVGQSSVYSPVVTANGNDITWRNIRITAGAFRMFQLANSSSRFAILNSTLNGATSFFGNSQQIRVDGCTFLGRSDGESMMASWNGKWISITNTLARDQDINNSGLIAAGRLYVGSTPGSSQRGVYIGNNTTQDFAPRAGASDQNAGEQILWDQNAGNMVTRTLVSATADTIRFNVSSFSNDHDIVIMGGKGVGQRRSVKSFDAATGTITVDRPWGVIPDASSIVITGRVVANVAVYNNTLDGKSDYATRVTASSGVNVFNDVFDLIVDKNTITDVRTGVNLNPVSQSSTRLPIYNTLVSNNIINNTVEAIALLGGGDPLVQPALTTTVVRDNSADGSTQRAVRLTSGNMNVIEGNTFTNTWQGIGNVTSGGMHVQNIVVRNNTFTRGTANFGGSIGFVPITDAASANMNLTPSLSGNTFTGFETTFGKVGSGIYGGRVYGTATANNGKLYIARFETLDTTAKRVIDVFDPARPLEPPKAFISAVANGDNGHLQGVRAIVFTNSNYAGPNENPVNCDMYVLNNHTGSVSRYAFNAAGEMSYLGEVITGLGNAVGMTLTAGGDLLIVSVDADPVTSGNQPRLFRWNGSTLTTLIDTPQFTYGGTSTIRNPGGVAVDSSGRIYISYSSVAGIRRFTSSGAFDADIAAGASATQINRGPDGRIYFQTGKTIRAVDPSTLTVSIFSDTTTVPALVSPSAMYGFGWGAKTVADADPNSQGTLFLGTSSVALVGVRGAGSATSGHQLDLRENVYGIGDITPYRVIEVSGEAGSVLNSTLSVRNSGAYPISYTLSESSPWLSITSNASGTLDPQGVANAALSINTSGLSAGAYTADVTFAYASPGQSGTQKARVLLTVTPGGGGGGGILIEENFNYGGSSGNLAGRGAATDGWKGAWSGSVTPKYAPATNLSYGASGYAHGNNTSSTGSSNGGTNRGHIAHRQLGTSDANGLDGTIWLSALVRVNASNGDALLWFDTTSSGDGGRDGIGVYGGGISRVYNGGNFIPIDINGPAAGNGTVAINQTHLLLMKIVMNEVGTSDSMYFWFNPDLSGGEPAQNTALWAGTGANTLGATLDRIGVSFGQTTSFFDAIRISNSPNGFALVTGGITGMSAMTFSAPNGPTYNLSEAFTVPQASNVQTTELQTTDAAALLDDANTTAPAPAPTRPGRPASWLPPAPRMNLFANRLIKSPAYMDLDDNPGETALVN